MEQKALYSLSYGLYLVGTHSAGKDAGCIVNTLQQVTSSPPRLSITINKDNATCRAIAASGQFAATVLTTATPQDVISVFGFSTSAERDKFAGFDNLRDDSGNPYLPAHMAARYSVTVESSLDVGTHIIFAGLLTEAEVLADEEVMTYSYYHKVKNGITPPKASAYQEPTAAKGWKCTVCGHIHEEDAFPEDYTCPVCGVESDMFERIV